MSPALQAANAVSTSALPVPGYERVRDLKDYLAVLPDPAAYVFFMTPDQIAAMGCAYRRKGILYLPREIAPHLRDYGLVDYASDALTVFGASVYRILEERAR